LLDRAERLDPVQELHPAVANLTWRSKTTHTFSLDFSTAVMNWRARLARGRPFEGRAVGDRDDRS
jgi:hypothetical protein